MFRNSWIHSACRIAALSLLIHLPQTQADSLLNGLAIHKELNTDLFIGGLYTDTLSNDAATQFSAPGSKRLELRVIAKRLSSRRLNSLWIEGMAINNPADQLTSEANNMVDFTRLLGRSLRAGDILAIRGDDDSTTVTLNGIELGSIASANFFDMILRTWIGNVPLSSDFRDGLLTSGDVNSELLAQYESIQPSAARQQAVAKWATPTDTTPDTAADSTTQEPPKAQPQLAVAEPVKIQTQIAKPQLAAPVAIAPTTPKATAATAETKDKPAASTPAKAVAQAKPAAKPEVSKPTPAKAQPAQIAKAAVAREEEEFFDDEEDFEEDAGPLLTAESLLSRQLYHSELLRWTYKYIEYPARAVDRRHEGSVRIAVVIDREGEVMSVSEVEASKYSSLNREALRAVKRATPFPPIPEGIQGQEFAFSLPIVFKLPD